MSNGVDLQFAFGLKPEAAIAYFNSMGYRVSDDALSSYLAIKERAYTIAGVLKEDILKDTKEALHKALAKGTSFEAFKQEVETSLAKRGYLMSGRSVVDADGEVVARNIAPYRLKTVYRTNLQSAYMAGRYQQMQEDVEFAPYWQYLAIMDAKTRPSHRSAHGLVFRHDDPFWDSHFPPCDFNCRCTVRSLTERDLKRFGLSAESSEGRMSETLQEVGKTGIRTPVKTFTKHKRETPFTPRLGFGTRPDREVFAQPRMLNKVNEKRVEHFIGEDMLKRAESVVAKHQDFVKRHGLTHTQALSIAGYTDKLYKGLNYRLREGFASDEDIMYAMSLNNALDLLPNYTANKGISYRVIKEVTDLKAFDRYQVGAVVTEGFFTSSSKITNPQGFKSGQVRFIIEGKHGKAIEELSLYPQQQEVLFKSGTQFKVNRREEDKNTLIIHLQEL